MAKLLNNTQQTHRKGVLAAEFLDMPTVGGLTVNFPFNAVSMKRGSKIHVLRPSGNLTEIRGEFTHTCRSHDFYLIDVLLMGVMRITVKYQVSKDFGITTFYHATIKTF